MVVNLLQRSRRVSVRHEPHTFAGNTYWGTPLGSWRPDEEGIGADFAGLVAGAYKANAVVYACELTRMALFSQARFVWQQFSKGKPGDIFGTQDLGVLERPWPGGTTGDLLARMILDADMGGTAFVARTREDPGRLKRMRPDWVTIVLGSADGPAEANKQMDADIAGFLYHPGGRGSAAAPVALLPDEVAHFAPSPDPVAAYRGMSWLQPVAKEVEADTAATAHKLMFFYNGASPQLVVTAGAGVTEENFRQFIARMNAEHDGWQNAYRTLYLAPGSTVLPVGKDLSQLDFKDTQGAGETRIAAASGVHPVVAALSEGMQGSSLNAGNFNAAKRLVADRTLRPLWQAACSALETVVPAPAGAHLWFDERGIPFLQEDRKDAAEIQSTKAGTVRQLVEAGFTADSVTAAVEAEDLTLLVHTGMLSVQLQPPGVPVGIPSSSNGSGAVPKVAAGVG